MSESAHLSSVETLDRLRSQLVLFREKASPALHEVAESVSRLRLWLQGEGRLHWQREVRKCRVRVEVAEQQYFGARLSPLKDNTSVENAAGNRARRELRAAEEKLKTVNHWAQRLDTEVAPLLKPLSKLESVLEQRVPLAMAHLARLAQTLSEYTDTARLALSGRKAAQNEPPPEAAPASPSPSPENQ